VVGASFIECALAGISIELRKRRWTSAATIAQAGLPIGNALLAACFVEQKFRGVA
jgi:hypothetical protein